MQIFIHNIDTQQECSYLQCTCKIVHWLKNFFPVSTFSNSGWEGLGNIVLKGVKGSSRLENGVCIALTLVTKYPNQVKCNLLRFNFTSSLVSFPHLDFKDNYSSSRPKMMSHVTNILFMSRPLSFLMPLPLISEVQGSQDGCRGPRLGNQEAQKGPGRTRWERGWSGDLERAAVCCTIPHQTARGQTPCHCQILQQCLGRNRNFPRWWRPYIVRNESWIILGISLYWLTNWMTMYISFLFQKWKQKGFLFFHNCLNGN